MLLLKICKPLTMSVSSVERKWSLEPRNCLVITFFTPGKPHSQESDSAGKILDCKQRKQCRCQMWSASTVTEVTHTSCILTVNRSVWQIKHDLKEEPLVLCCVSRLLFVCCCGVMLCCLPLLPTAACAPGSRGSRPALPVAWTSSAHLITIRLQRRPRPHPLPLLPPLTPPQPHLPTVRVKIRTHKHFLLQSALHKAYPHLNYLQCRTHVMWAPSAVKNNVQE